MKVDGTESSLGKDIAAIAGPILGLLGLLYGFIKRGRPFYGYHREPQDLSHGSFLSRDERRLPEDYPDGHPTGLLLRNTGSGLRSFKVASREYVVFREGTGGDNLYELWYVFSRASQGTALRFSITFESAAGIQGKQVWEVIRGTKAVRRLKPRTPHAI